MEKTQTFSPAFFADAKKQYFADEICALKRQPAVIAPHLANRQIADTLTEGRS